MFRWLPACVVFIFAALFSLESHGESVVPRPAGVEFPILLETYQKCENQLMRNLNRPLTLWEILRVRVSYAPMNAIVTTLFFCAIIHTFLAPKFLRLSQRLKERHEFRLSVNTSGSGNAAETPVSFPATLCHFFGEIEAIFGIWIIPVAVVITIRYGWDDFCFYVSHRVSYVEAMFVVVIMTMAASKPILAFAERILGLVAQIGHASTSAWWMTILSVAPLLGSFITEPAAITIAAILLAQKFYPLSPSAALSYATLGLLFVNVSVGGTLTHFAAPPILIVAEKWHWDLTFVFTHFGWRAMIGIGLNTLLYACIFRRELLLLNAKAEALRRDAPSPAGPPAPEVPFWVTMVHILFIAWSVGNLHSPQTFWYTFLIFLAFIQATAHFQYRVALREPIFVGFFLAGLVTHGGLQEWWIAPVLERMSRLWLFFGSMALSTFNDNAAITYLTSLVPEFSGNRALQYAIAAGALSGGGLTVIANAPNPAGQSILQKFFPSGVSPLGLLAAAIPPTIILGSAFLLL
ncbi:MAG: putative Na+/H+ antiporter [Puniceicoccales bacterium]|jgi:hypothetical protein|nr:putative Na+/H+ antiporter [Puniceicoccales bacterium]